ncbi:Hypothetical protein NTJ_15973 [Nesidiocoris tenuis]|uniref:Uncharacterized protein n=1 Tax=Nesidiocoris tenuis TaxID=355587 RepID=A0ABN7BH89_9HEMI|nr:Hypothetical protein NTJ_15973 [Nesidiocoris tenuis]
MTKTIARTNVKTIPPITILLLDDITIAILALTTSRRTRHNARNGNRRSRGITRSSHPILPDIGFPLKTGR